MTTNELKTGMVVKLRDGWRGLVLRGCSFYFPFNNHSNYIIGADNDYIFLNNYNRDLTSVISRDYDIMFVYQPHSPYDVMDVLTDIDRGTDIEDCIFNREWDERGNKK